MTAPTPPPTRGLKWRRGTGKHGARVRSSKGYIRIYHGPDRGQYEPRVVMRTLCAEFCYYTHTDLWDPTSGLPIGFHVEHIDHQKTHNCPENLLLLQDIIHNFCSRDTAAVRRREARTISDMTYEEVLRMCEQAAAREAAEEAAALSLSPPPTPTRATILP